MVKQKLTLSVDSTLIEAARKRGIDNLSSLIEKCIANKLNLRKVTIEYVEECKKPCKDVTKYL